MKLALGCAMALAMAGAATAKTEVVVVRDYAAVANCQALGEVSASSSLGGVFQDASYKKVLRQIKERAAALGGTHLQLVDSASGFTGSRMLGTAYKCPTAPTDAGTAAT